jgi:hypothetical protein
MLNAVKPTAQVMAELRAECEATLRRMGTLAG